MVSKNGGRRLFAGYADHRQAGLARACDRRGLSAAARLIRDPVRLQSLKGRFFPRLIGQCKTL
jgi:hypothetical protein